MVRSLIAVALAALVSGCVIDPGAPYYSSYSYSSYGYGYAPGYYAPNYYAPGYSGYYYAPGYYSQPTIGIWGGWRSGGHHRGGHGR